MALSARLVVVLTALCALQPVYAGFPTSCDSQGITDQDSCTAFCDPDETGKKKGMWLGDPGPGACTCTGCLFCQTCANPKPQDDGTAVQSQSMHIESVGHGDREGRVSAQRASWEETKLQHQQTVQMQKLKDREQAASAKQKERTQSAHDKQLKAQKVKQQRVKAQRVRSAHMAAGLLTFMAAGAMLLSVGVMVVHRQRQNSSYSVALSSSSYAAPERVPLTAQTSYQGPSAGEP